RLRDRQQRDRVQAPCRFRRDRPGAGPNRERDEQQVQGNKRGWSRPLRRALLIEWDSSLELALGTVRRGAAIASRRWLAKSGAAPWLGQPCQSQSFNQFGMCSGRAISRV